MCHCWTLIFNQIFCGSNKSLPATPPSSASSSASESDTGCGSRSSGGGSPTGGDFQNGIHNRISIKRSPAFRTSGAKVCLQCFGSVTTDLARLLFFCTSWPSAQPHAVLLMSTRNRVWSVNRASTGRPNPITSTWIRLRQPTMPLMPLKISAQLPVLIQWTPRWFWASIYQLDWLTLMISLSHFVYFLMNDVESEWIFQVLDAVVEEALRAPLPTGPAPKKPPRTFQHDIHLSQGVASTCPKVLFCFLFNALEFSFVVNYFHVFFSLVPLAFFQ